MRTRALELGIVVFVLACSRGPGAANPPVASPTSKEKIAMPASTDILGFALGAPLDEAVRRAPSTLHWPTATGPYRQATGGFEGMRLGAQLKASAGILIDIAINLTDAKDASLAAGRPLAALTESLGAPTAQTSDSAHWKTMGWQVELNRAEIFEKGDDVAQIEYSLRARTLPLPSAQPAPADETARKQREEAAAGGK